MPDVVPFALDLSHWFYEKNRMPWDLSAAYMKPETELIEYHKRHDVGFYMANGACFFEVRNPLDVRTSVTKNADWSEITWEIETPLGVIRRKRRWEAGNYAWGISQWGVRTRDDLHVLAHALAGREYVPRWKLYKPWVDCIGGTGVVYGMTGYSAMGQLMHYWMGAEATLYAVADWPEEMRDAIEAINANCLKCVDMLAESPAEVVIMGDNFSSDIQPPHFFAEWSQAYYAEAIRRFHAAGKFVAIHIDGRLRGALRMFREIGADCADAVTPAPMGDLMPEECREEAGEMILSGGIPPDLWYSRVDIEDFKRAVMRWLELRKWSTRLIAAAGDQVPPGAEEDRIFIMRDMVETRGRF